MFRGMSTPAVAAATAHLTTEHFQPAESVNLFEAPSSGIY
ncbi:Putative transcriptional regulator [Mycobacteroides abscessus subsp. abscessus]|nr:Putative transcriptional regulator [Mycobacteroides abscessus subsp. abscessus]